MNKLNLFFVCALFSLLNGCAVDNQSTATRGIGKTYQSAVKPQPDGSFFIEAEAAPLAGRQSGAVSVVTEQASNFCAQRNKKMVEIQKTTDSHLLINGVARLHFRCE